MKIKSNIKSYIGFALKSGQIIFGIDNLKKSKLNSYIIIYSGDLSENGKKDLSKYLEKKNIKAISFEDIDLSQLVNRNNCKIVGILDQNLANAIIKNLDN